MNPSQENSREFLQRAIDVEIKSLEESIQALKFRRNALSPISSLPPELFAVIFSILCLPGTSSPGIKTDQEETDEEETDQYDTDQDDTDQDDTDEEETDQDDTETDQEETDPRLCVSHVCHQWREIVLNQPLLWSHVDFASLSLAGTAEILDRAKSSPLHLKANLSSSWILDNGFSKFRKELQARVPNICYLSLRISTAPDFLHRTLQGLLSPAPNLEHLSISCCDGYHGPLFRTDGGRSSIPDNLFDSSTPRLSYLELCDCNISWRSPLLKGLKHLKILTSSANSRPELAVWLSTLDEMPQLTTLNLHLASPVAPPFPFDVTHIVTLPSLTSLGLLASPEDCALALAHLDLPALTSLSLTVQLLDTSGVQSLLPFVARHAHGPQDSQPLQCVLIRSGYDRVDIFAWPAPIIDAKTTVHELPTLLPATLPTRVSLSFRGRDDGLGQNVRLEILETVLACLPLGGLVMLAAYDLSQPVLPTHFWNHLSPNWPLLQCVLLSDPAVRGFLEMLEDKGGRERPSLPSLSQLVLIEYPFDIKSFVSLCRALPKRMEQGFPVERLDLRRCFPRDLDAEILLPSLSRFVGGLLGPEKFFGKPEFWAVVHDPFVNHDHSVTCSDDYE